MHPIETSPDGYFYDGDEPTRLRGTVVSAAWLNAVQGELLALLGAAEIEPDPQNAAQVLAAVLTLLADPTRDHSGTPEALAGRLMLRDADGRAQVAAPLVDADIARKDTIRELSMGRLGAGTYRNGTIASSYTINTTKHLITTIHCGAVMPGDVVFVQVSVSGTKTSSSGVVITGQAATGGAQLQPLPPNTFLDPVSVHFSPTGNELFTAAFPVYFLVAGAGNLSLEVYGHSFNQTFTCELSVGVFVL